MHDAALVDLLSKFIVTLPAIIFAFAAWRSSKKTHNAVNGRMDEFKKLMKQNADLYRKLYGSTTERKGDKDE